MVSTNGLDISCVGSMPLNLGRAPPLSIQYPVHHWSMCSTILAVQRQTSYSSGSQHKGLRSVRGRKCGGKHAAVSTLHFTLYTLHQSLTQHQVQAALENSAAGLRAVHSEQHSPSSHPHTTQHNMLGLNGDQCRANNKLAKWSVRCIHLSSWCKGSRR